MPEFVPARGPAFRSAIIAFLVAALVVPTALWANRQPPAVPSVGGVPLFGTWPADRKPDAVLLISGQTYGYLRPCGCSVNQKGGLERRYNLVKALQDKGWPVVGFDLGDAASTAANGTKTSLASMVGKVPEQNALKYVTAMKAMKAMNYAAVGLGESEFESPLFELLSQYAYQTTAGPHIVAANLGVTVNGAPMPRAEYFKGVKAGDPDVVRDYAVGTAGAVAVAAVGTVGGSVAAKATKLDPTLAFADNAKVLAATLAKVAADPAKPAVRVLLYQGTQDEATKAAAAFPQFDVVVCNIEESEPPQFPQTLNGGKTLLVQVGHKGQNVGLVGVFKKPDGGYEFKYQLVPLTEDFVTPKDDAKLAAHPVLKLLEAYALDVKKKNLLPQFTANPLRHPAQIDPAGKGLTFVGSEKCFSCHAAEAAVWKSTSHSHAMEALEKIADRPKNRQFDGECVQCHTVGFGFKSGHIDDSTTPQLRHVGCESCHGPGSGHTAAPNNKALLALMSPWKQGPKDRLPDLDVLKKLSEVKPGEVSTVAVPPNQQQVMTAVSGMCMKCHDQENDPKFDLNKYMHKIWHSGLKAGAAGGAKAGK